MDKQMQAIKTIAYSELYLWDVKRLVKSDILSKYDVVELSHYIIERSEKVKLSDFPNKEYGILGVNNKVGLFDAYKERGKNINQAYKRVKKHDLAYNPYRVNVGSIGLKTESQKNDFISPAYVVFSTQSKLSPEFLYRVFKTNVFNRIIRDNTTGSVRQNLKFDTLAKIKVPLPPLDKQQQIVEAYNAKINLAQKQEEEAKALEEGIDNYLFEILAIDQQEIVNADTVLQFIKFSEMPAWGVDKILRGNFRSVLTSSKFPNQKVSSVAYVNPKTDLSGFRPDDQMSFIPMAYIDDKYGEVLNMDVGCKKKSKGYTKFQNNDLLWARITPCMQNGKSAIVKGLLNSVGYGSTEYHVLRKKTETFSMRFLYYLLRSKAVRQDAINHFTGSAGQQRVPKTYLENLTVPVPPLEVQHEIVNHVFAIKEKVKALHAQAKDNREKAVQELEKEIFT